MATKIIITYSSYGVNLDSDGGRFQYLIADYKNKDNDVYLDYIRFIIYGVTLTATYNFSF